MYEKISKWFRQGLWTEGMVQAAGKKGLLTPEEVQSLLGEGV